MEEAPDLEVVVHTYHFNMRVEEVEAFLEKNELPERLQEFANHSLLWYALFSNSVDYCYKIAYKGEPAKISQAVAELCELFKSRGMFVDLLEREEVVKVTIQEFSKEKELLHAGREEGIEGAVQMLAELGLTEGQAIEKIAKTYNLSDDEARFYTENHYH